MNIAILSHFLINPIENEATSTCLADYLSSIKKVNYILQLEQPFTESKDTYSYEINIFKHKKETKKHKATKSGVFAYLLHPVLNFFLLLKSKKNYDLGIACENLSFLSLFLLKKLNLVNNTIYYSVDYTPKRFENSYLNWIYHYLDRLALYNSDEAWVVSKAQIEARKKNGVIIRKIKKIKIVPIGWRASQIDIKPFSKLNYYNIIFAGSLRESSGPQLVLEALPMVIKKIPKIKVTFLGNGDKNKLVRLAKKNKIKSHIKFIQNISDHKKFSAIISKSSIGLAPYAPIENSISLTSDPGKIKLYLLCGLPVITTKIATSHTLLEKNKAGIAIEYDKKQLANAIVEILKNKNKYKRYRQNAVSLGQEFDTNNIFSKALKI